ncbi:MAG: uridine kinase [Candidatus Marinimicrobia bacterium]|nr:uridine kinase [Candidatus Neomarinimicrobiota bacterium]
MTDSLSKHNCIIIGIAGGSGSGKTMVSKAIVKDFKRKGATIIEQDWYYYNLPKEKKSEWKNWNFDHPNAVEFSLLQKQLKQLQKGESINAPQYEYSTHSRMKETLLIEPQKVIIVEGILILNNPQILKLLDIKLYVDTDSDVRFIRRLKRDIFERGRTIENVIEQYYKTVRPMHLTFVEPSKRNADIIIPEGGKNKVAIDLLKSKIKMLLRDIHD